MKLTTPRNILLWLIVIILCALAIYAATVSLRHAMSTALYNAALATPATNDDYSSNSLINARDQLQDSAAAMPLFAEPWNALHYVALKLDARDEVAEQHLRRALSVRPTTAVTWAQYAAYCSTRDCSGTSSVAFTDMALRFGPMNSHVLATTLTVQREQWRDPSGQASSALDALARRYLELSSASAIAASINGGWHDQLRPLLSPEGLRKLDRELRRRVDSKPGRSE